MLKRVFGMALSCALACGLWGCVENTEMTTPEGSGTPGGQQPGTPGGQQPGGSQGQPEDGTPIVCEGRLGLIDDLYQENYPDSQVTKPEDTCPETHPHCIDNHETFGTVCSRCEENYLWDAEFEVCQYDDPAVKETPCGIGEYGCVVDNDAYCDGLCEADEYCLLGSDFKTGACSHCDFDCAHMNALYPVCVVLDGGIGAACVATADCPNGYEFDAGVGHYVCKG